MKIQSLSVVVPNRTCINKCRFCVACMHPSPYPNMMDENKPFYDLYQKDYIQRLEFARDNGCNTVMLTGNSEPQQNRGFLERFGTINNDVLKKPFRWIEMQTTGVLLDENYLRFLRNHVRVSTISLSLSSLTSALNAYYNQTPEKFHVNIAALCASIKKYDFNLRLSLNLTESFNMFTSKQIFEYINKEFGADQVTFRVLYTSTNDESKMTEQDRWIKQNAAQPSTITQIRRYIEENGRPLEKLEFGAIKWSVNGISTVLDDDCMNTEAKEELKYVILQPNCKLYSKWDDPASLIF